MFPFTGFLFPLLEKRRGSTDVVLLAGQNSEAIILFNLRSLLKVFGYFMTAALDERFKAIRKPVCHYIAAG